MQDLKVDDADLEKICKIADKTGRVVMPVWPSAIINMYYFQVTKNDFEKYSRDSKIFKALDKNKDGHVSAAEVTSKAELAFKVRNK